MISHRNAFSETRTLYAGRTGAAWRAGRTSAPGAPEPHRFGAQPQLFGQAVAACTCKKCIGKTTAGWRSGWWALGRSEPNHLGTRSPFSLTTAWQRGRSSLAKPRRPLPPGAANDGEFMYSSTFSMRARKCAGVSARLEHRKFLVEQPAGVRVHGFVRVDATELPREPLGPATML